MKRNLDLLRELMLRIEAEPIPQCVTGAEIILLHFHGAPLQQPGEDPDEIAYQMRLLVDAGFFDMAKNRFAAGIAIRGITWKGHDFIDSVRDDEVWRRTKEGALAAGGFSVDLLIGLAKGFIKKQVFDRTGIEL